MVITYIIMITIITIITMDKVIIVEDVVNVHDDDDRYADNSWYGSYDDQNIGQKCTSPKKKPVEIFGARGPGWERDGGMRQSELDRRRVRRTEQSAPAAARCQCKCSSSGAAAVVEKSDNWCRLPLSAGPTDLQRQVTPCLPYLPSLPGGAACLSILAWGKRGRWRASKREGEL